MSLPALPPNQRERLVKFLGLLGSHHMGERATAGQMASELLRSLRLCWDDVIVTAVFPAPQPIPADDWVSMAEAVTSCERATQWELDFANNLLRGWAARGRQISERQLETLERIYLAKCARYRA